MKFLDVKNIIINTNNAIILYIERTLWRIIDLYVHGGRLGGHLGFWKSHAGGERPPGLNFIETHDRTIEKSKETIVKRPNKVMGHATGLLVINTNLPPILHRFRDIAVEASIGPKSLYLATPLMFNSPGGGVPLLRSPWNFQWMSADGQGT